MQNEKTLFAWVGNALYLRSQLWLVIAEHTLCISAAFVGSSFITVRIPSQDEVLKLCHYNFSITILSLHNHARSLWKIQFKQRMKEQIPT